MPLIAYLQNTPVAFYILACIFGLVVGSFLNVVIYRLPIMLERDWKQQCRILLNLETADADKSDEFNIVRPRSRCPHCGHQISAFENIPVFSYLALGGKCSACKTTISMRYPIIEILAGLLALFCAWHYGFGLQALLAILLSWALLTLSVIDIDHQLLPDDIILPLMWVGILANMFGTFTDIYSSLFGVMAGYTVLWTVYILFKIATGKEGMGHGDFKLLAMLGGWLGWQMLPLIILLSSLVGALAGLGLIFFKHHDRGKPIPFGPYLAVAGWIALLWGHSLTMAYYHWAVSP